MLGDLVAAIVGCLLALVLIEWIGGEGVGGLGTLLFALGTIRHRSAIFRAVGAGRVGSAGKAGPYRF